MDGVVVRMGEETAYRILVGARRLETFSRTFKVKLSMCLTN
jgi:hypothetical protein